MHNDRYPMGKLTIPWAIADGFLAIWTFAPLYTYHISFSSTRYGWGRESVGTQDFPGYVGFISVSIFTLLALAVYAVVHSNTLSLSLPRFRDLVLPFVMSTVVLGIPYLLAGVFYDNERFHFPYDGNWAAISGLCSIGFVHYVLFNALLKRNQQSGVPDTPSSDGNIQRSPD